MKISCSIFSCLLTCASIPLSAQVNLGSVNLGSKTSTTVTVTIANAGTLANLSVVTGGSANLDFTNAGSGTCSDGTPYAANATCTVQVSFSPKYPGTRIGAVVLFDGNGNVMTTNYLQGMGLAPKTSFQPATQSIGNRGTNQGIFSPAALAEDASGNLYVGDGEYYCCGPGPGGATIYGYVEENGTDLTGNPLDFIPQIFSPEGIAADGAGNVYITSTSDYAELVMEPNGSLNPILNATNGVLAVDGAGNLYSRCSTGVCKETLQTDGSYIATTIASEISSTSLAVDGSGDVFIPAGSLYKFTPHERRLHAEHSQKRHNLVGGCG